MCLKFYHVCFIFFYYFAALNFEACRKIRRGAGVAELARLESVSTAKRYRGFESPSLRQKEGWKKPGKHPFAKGIDQNGWFQKEMTGIYLII